VAKKNVKVSCRTCNRSKGKKPVKDWDGCPRRKKKKKPELE